MSPSSFPSVILKGLGAYVPEQRLTNADLSKIVDTSDEWIASRTGIRERRIAGDNETASDMAEHAARRALHNARIAHEAIDLLIVATMTPDMPFPSTACLVQQKLGLRSIPSFDIQAACSGYLYTQSLAVNMIRSGHGYRNVLVIGTERLSRILDWKDRATCVLFGDGAGAVVLSSTEQPDIGVLGTALGADGSNTDMLCMPGGGSACPPTTRSVREGLHFLKMNGRETFKIAIRVMEQCSKELLDRFGLGPDDISCVIPHQANMRIIEALAERLMIPIDRFLVNIDRYGNTSAASIPIALEEACQQKKIHSGDYILMAAFGAGLTWGASLIKWP